jgi:hypothetical protein
MIPDNLDEWIVIEVYYTSRLQGVEEHPQCHEQGLRPNEGPRADPTRHLLGKGLP